MAEHPRLFAIPQWLRYAIVTPPAALLYYLVETWAFAVGVSGESLPDHAFAGALTWSAAQAVLAEHHHCHRLLEPDALAPRAGGI